MIREIVTDTAELNKESVDYISNPELLVDLKDTIESIENAAGLSAVQIGTHERVFILQMKKEGGLRYFINPIVQSHSKKWVNSIEECLSFPDKCGVNVRWKSVCIKHLDESGKECISTFKDFWAFCVQHEMDHLDGKTIERSASGLISLTETKKDLEVHGCQLPDLENH